MNTENLRRLIDELLVAEKTYNIQGILEPLRQELEQLADSPQDQSRQISYANTLGRLNSQMAAMILSFSPARLHQIEEIGAADHFLRQLGTEIATLSTQNPHTPAVVLQYLSQMTAARGQYLERLGTLQQQLQLIGVTASTVEPGTAELGVTIPRIFFEDKFDGFIKELKTLSLIIRIFSEAITGSADSPEVHQISTSDPLLFLGMDVTVIVAIAGAITWSLDTLQRLADLRKAKTVARETAGFSEQELSDFFDTKVKDIETRAIQLHIEQMRSESSPVKTLSATQKGEMEWALKALLSKIERGMTIEVRFLPAVPADGEEADLDQTAAYGRLVDLERHLVFPTAPERPITALAPPEPPKAPKTKEKE